MYKRVRTAVRSNETISVFVFTFCNKSDGTTLFADDNIHVNIHHNMYYHSITMKQIVFLCIIASISSFSPTLTRKSFNTKLLSSAEESSELDLEIASSKFKIVTCTSTSCSRRRQQLGMDQLATFASFYSRSRENAPSIKVEESPCLGSCKRGALVNVAVHHEDFLGPVSLEGMRAAEFSDRVFHK